MITTILREDSFPGVKKVQKKFNIFRAIDIKSDSILESVEFMNKDGVFRGFGRNTNEAFKNAKQVLKKYYNSKQAIPA
ncbi:MAG: hypothetical protein U9N30_05295 [Campylobacterota bacterium]|nr:hypothetical protein [Campylobacterota bacterium]